MENQRHVWKHQKKLRTGYTTGSCAAAAAKAAANMLLGGNQIEQVKLETPKGVVLYLDVEHICHGKDYVSCAIQKDSGDDPDVTNGIYVYAKVAKRADTRIVLKGGEGVGLVTKKGLEQKVGQPAINKVPRMMILEAAAKACHTYGYQAGLTVTITIPEGTALAGKTFNPRLGIEGGVSVLGTTGIVEPMSEKALTDTIYLEMKVLKENGHDYCYVAPGNYGSDFLSETLGYDSRLAVKCSNFIGEVIDDAVRLEMKGILLIGHIGKLIKIAAGVMNTHSRQADCRLEVLAAHAGMAGAGGEMITAIMECITTTEALEMLAAKDLLRPVMATVMERLAGHLGRRAGDSLEVGAIMFAPEQGVLGRTDNTDRLLRLVKGAEA